MKSLVSVITPVHNGSLFLREHLESVRSNLHHEFEVLYVDNNSSDDSLSQIKSLAEVDKRVRLFQCDLQGVSFARNTAVDNARGDVLVFLDVDDLLVGSGVNKQVDIARHGHISQCKVYIDKVDTVSPVWNNTMQQNFFLSFGNQLPFSSFVCPTSEIRFNETLETSEDWLFIMQNRKLFGSLRLIENVARRYNPSSGYSRLVSEDVKYTQHITAFAVCYDLSRDNAHEVLNRFYYGKRQRTMSALHICKFFMQLYGLAHPKCLLKSLKIL